MPPFAEDHSHHLSQGGLDLGQDAFQGAHERAHADDIRRRFDGRHATKRAPYLSGALIILVGLYVGCQGAMGVLAQS